MSPVKTDVCSPDSAHGPPASPAEFLSPAALSRAMLEQADCVASVWPAFADLRAAASNSKPSRLHLVVSAMVCEARLVFAASYLVARGEPAPDRAPRTLPGRTLHRWILAMLTHGAPALCDSWRWTQPQLQHLHAQLCRVAAPTTWTPSPVTVALFSCDIFTWTDRPVQFPAALTTFLHALRVGAPWALALDTFADLPCGYLSADGRVFATRHLLDPSGHPTHHVALADADDSEALNLFFSPAGLVAVACSHTLRPKPLPSPEGMIANPRGVPFPSRFLPPYIKLRKRPKRDLTSVYRSAAAWHRRLGPLDATATMVVEGRLHMPKDRLILRPFRRLNHASWEHYEAVKLALGPKFATWIWQGIVEMIPPGCPTPLFIEPLGAVDKATDPWYRLIPDARLSNKLQGPWGVWYSSVSQFAALLDVYDIMFAGPAPPKNKNTGPDGSVRNADVYNNFKWGPDQIRDRNSTPSLTMPRLKA
jgi:hypothetical protein